MIVRSLLAASVSLAVLATPVFAQPAPEQPLAPERNPPGDIPDNQVFVVYASPLGFSLQVPEGWGREDLPDGAVFADNYDLVALSAAPGPQPTAATATQDLVLALEASGHAVTITAIADVTLPAGNAVRISYQSNSEPNAVTGRAVRLEHDRYYFWRNGTVVVLDLAAPAGADNVDQWQLMSASFAWL